MEVPGWGEMTQREWAGGEGSLSQALENSSPSRARRGKAESVVTWAIAFHSEVEAEGRELGSGVGAKQGMTLKPVP